MTLDGICAMTLDQIILGGAYPAAANVRKEVPTGAIDSEGEPITGTLDIAADNSPATTGQIGLGL